MDGRYSTSQDFEIRGRQRQSGGEDESIPLPDKFGILDFRVKFLAGDRKVD